MNRFYLYFNRVITRLLIIIICFVLPLSLYSQKGIVNKGSKIGISNGAYLKITGDGANYTNQSEGVDNGRIDLDGEFLLQGNWYNNATSGSVLINTNTDGKVIFAGSVLQTIAGSRPSSFEQLIIKNSSEVQLGNNQNINYLLNLSGGKISLENNDLTIANSASIIGAGSSSKMIVTDGTGVLKKMVNANGEFVFPVGDNISTAEYSPLSFSLNSNSGLSSAWVSVSVSDEKLSANTSPSEYLTRYWTINSGGITNPQYNIECSYLTSDIVGIESEIYAAKYDGINRDVYSVVIPESNSLNINNLTSFSDITGVDGTAPTTIISTSEPNPTNSSSFDIQISFNEDVNGFELTDITVDNATASNLINITPNQVWDVSITPINNGEVTVDINANIAEDFAGNGNIAALQLSVIYDSENPYISSSNPEDNQADVNLTANLEINFNEIVNVGTGNIYLYKISGDILVQSFDVTSDITGDGSATITANPSSELESLTNYYVKIDATAFDDNAGNSYTGISDNTTWNFSSVDIDDPVDQSLSPADNSSNVGVSVNLEIEFSENVQADNGNVTIKKASDNSDFEIIDINSTQVTISNAMLTVNPTVSFDGETEYYILIDGTAIKDMENNYYAGISSTTYWNFITEDITDPINTNLNPENGTVDVLVDNNLVIQFNEDVAKGTGNIVIRKSDASLFETIDVSSGQITVSSNSVTINPTSDFDSETTYYVLIDAEAIDDLSGNSYSGISSDDVWRFTTEDIVSPEVTVSSNEPDPTNNTSFIVDIQFTEEVTGFNIGDIEVDNGTASDIQTPDNISYTVSVSPSIAGTVTVEIPDNVAQDLNGNLNIASNVFSIEYDDMLPYATISSTENNPTNSSPIIINIDFTETMVGFELTDIQITNGLVNALETSNNMNFSIDVLPNVDGEITIQVPAGVAENTTGTENVASDVFSIVSDRTAPSIIISSSVASPTNSSTIELNIEFDEAVSGFDLSDIVLSNATVSNLNTTNNIIYTVELLATNEGEITVDINAGIAQDDAGNGNIAASQFSIVFDGSSPTISINSYVGDTIRSADFTVEIEFSEEVNNFEISDIEIVNAGITNMTSTDSISFTLETSAIADGLVTIFIPQDVCVDNAGNNNLESEQFSTYYSTSVGIDNWNINNVLIYSNIDNIIIDLTKCNRINDASVNLDIFNILGEKVYENSNIVSNIIKVRIEQNKGIYIVRLISNNKIYTKKVLLK